MDGMALSFQRFVEASPHVYRAKKRRHSATRLRASTIDASRKLHTRRRLCGGLGLHMLQYPSQKPSAPLTQPPTHRPLKRGHLLRRWLGMEKLLKQAHTL